jgi:hypothetical protein
MRSYLLSGLCCASLVALLPDTAHAHGGQYRGPGDVVPPGPGGGGGRTGGPSGPTTGGPAGPSAPAPSGPATGGPAGPSTGGPAGPAGGRGPTTGGGGMQLIDDLTTWDYWWEFNKDPFIRLRDSIHSGGPVTGSDDFYLGASRRSEARDSLKPTAEQIQGEILPALKKSLDAWQRSGGSQVNIPSSCMIAMAKIGVDHPEFKLRDVFTPHLKANNQELRETAALSLGIAALGGEEEVNVMMNLARDNAAGKALSDGSVHWRTRSFAAYGLGLTAHRTTNIEIKKKAFEVLKEVMKDDRRDVQVAAINAMGLLNIGTTEAAEKALLDEVLQTLEGFYMQKLGASDQLVQSHVPTAIAKLIGRDHARSDYYKDLFAADLEDKGKIKRSSIEIPQSCALALGQLVRPYDNKDEKKCPDAKYSKLLADMWDNHKDVQTRNFSVLSLGFIGGDLNKEVLLKLFDKAGKNQEKPWVAMSLGVYSYFKYEAQKAANAQVEPETFIGETLYDALKKNKEPSIVGALAIALGLNRMTEAADEMRKRMSENHAKEQMAGYLCIGLALMNDTRSTEEIRDTLKQSVRRPSLLMQAAIALGKLGDKSVAEDLQALMKDGVQTAAKLSGIASAIGFIGDSRTIAPLKEMLFDEKLAELSRAFAAVALGGVGDKEMVPWNSKIATNMNYRAAVETLTNRQTGILDIL